MIRENILILIILVQDGVEKEMLQGYFLVDIIILDFF